MQQEQQSIMESTKNIEHKTIIYLIYMFNKHVSCLYSLVSYKLVMSQYQIYFECIKFAWAVFLVASLCSSSIAKHQQKLAFGKINNNELRKKFSGKFEAKNIFIIEFRLLKNFWGLWGRKIDTNCTFCESSWNWKYPLIIHIISILVVIWSLKSLREQNGEILMHNFRNECEKENKPVSNWIKQFWSKTSAFQLKISCWLIDKLKICYKLDIHLQNFTITVQ